MKRLALCVSTTLLVITPFAANANKALVEKNGWHGWTGEGTAKGEAWRTRVLGVTQPGSPTWAAAHHPRHLLALT